MIEVFFRHTVRILCPGAQQLAHQPTLEPCCPIVPRGLKRAFELIKIRWSDTGSGLENGATDHDAITQPTAAAHACGAAR
ncbi:hypothetical protein cyc_03564 [Cyclospora cayetanensis]|uniref:Uncharacterized protein n=1 Tax=Cyclospora cayetanensis TaxID=88456 RepID=A0A1D3CW20_9EIME|nr:hypothetical protein cyc_03564 [Cyclospora cayetanensis]